MYLFLLLGIYFLCGLVGAVSNKKNSSVLRGGTTDRPVYFLITALCALLFFACMNGFRISVNRVTWIYAALFSLCVLVSLMISLVVYRLAKIPTVSVVQSALSLLATSFIGSVLFSENVDFLTKIRILLLVAASVLLYFASFFGEKKQKNGDDVTPKPENGVKNKIAFVVIMACLVLDSCAVTLITKSFALREDVSDANSFYFATNLIILVVGIIWLLIVGRGKFRAISKGLRELKAVDYVFILLSTLSSNLSSLITIPLVAMLEVASFTAYTSALTIVAAEGASFVFREKQNVFSFLAIIVAVISFMIGAI